MEYLDATRAGVVTVLVKLPTGDEDVPGYGQSGLALASTLVCVGELAIVHPACTVAPGLLGRLPYCLFT